MNPKVAVIIPTVNRAILLERAIQSILYQDYDNIELIIVPNNNYSDEIIELCEKYPLKCYPLDETFDETFEVPKGDERHLLFVYFAKAIDYGFSKLPDDTKYVNFFCDDDIMAPHRISAVTEFMEKTHGVDVAYGYMRIVYCDGYNHHRLFYDGTRATWKHPSNLQLSVDICNRLISRGALFRSIRGMDHELLDRLSAIAKMSYIDVCTGDRLFWSILDRISYFVESEFKKERCTDYQNSMRPLLKTVLAYLLRDMDDDVGSFHLSHLGSDAEYPFAGQWETLQSALEEE